MKCMLAIYASGPARASGGCGAVAMLIGLHSDMSHHCGWLGIKVG